MSRSIRTVLVFLLLLVPGLAPHAALAEKVADLPAPTGYVNDFAGVIDPQTKQQVEALCTAVDRQAGAQIAIVTIKTLDDDETVEDFTVSLEEKWKVGKKGTDKGLLMLIVMNPKKLRTEVGYGLEGILPDALVGRIQDTMVPYLHDGNYNAAVTTGVRAYAGIIAKDAGVTLAVTPMQHTYHREAAPQQGIGIGGLIGIAIVVGLVILMIATGNGGFLWVIISMLMNGGGGGGGGGRGRDGGGFGGFGGGSSGGGGASSDY
jgi:uncharacterized protein